MQRAAEGAGVASGIAGPDDPDLLMELANGRSRILLLAADVRIFARALDGALRPAAPAAGRHAPNRKESHVGT